MIKSFSCSKIQSETSVESVGKLFFPSFTAAEKENPLTADEYKPIEQSNKYDTTMVEFEKKLNTDGRVWIKKLTTGGTMVWKKNYNTTPETVFSGRACSQQIHRLVQYGHLFNIGKDKLVGNLGSLNGCQVESSSCTNKNRTFIKNSEHGDRCISLVERFEVMIHTETVVIADLNRIVTKGNGPSIHNECTMQRPLTGNLFIY